MDTENAHTDTQQVQRRRRKQAEEEEAERAKRKKFQIMVGSALDLMSTTSRLDSKINRINTAVQDVNNMEDKIIKDEATVLDLRVKLLEAPAADNEPLAEVYAKCLDHHMERVTTRNEELVALKATVKRLTAEYDAAQANTSSSTSAETSS